MQLLTHHDPDWELQFESLAFTVEALLAHPEPDDQELGRLAARTTAVLADWEEIDADGRGLGRNALHAAARVRAADIALDHALGVFAADVLEAASGDRASELYGRFFPEAHEDVLEMGLDASLPVVMLGVLSLEQDSALPEGLRAHSTTLKDAVSLGNAALAERAEAFADLGRHQARVEAWKETAAATHRNLFRALTRLATARGLPERWASAFFLGGRGAG